MSEFKVGDRVKGSAVRGSVDTTGMIGTIKHAGNEESAVEFDLPFSRGHDCCEYCTEGHGYWCWNSGLLLIEELGISQSFKKILRNVYGGQVA